MTGDRRVVQVAYAYATYDFAGTDGVFYVLQSKRDAKRYVRPLALLVLRSMGAKPPMGIEHWKIIKEDNDSKDNKES